MKSTIVFSSIFLTTIAAAALTTDVKKELLLDIKEETKKCAVEVLTLNRENKEVAGYETHCETLKLISSTEAQVFIDGAWFVARVQESAESDGGDLDDLFVYNDRNELVAQKSNVAAYDSIVKAMAGDAPLEQKAK
jgi:hypothetical protein